MIQARWIPWRAWPVLMCSILVVSTGCQLAEVEAPDYSRPLPPGVNALRRITDPARMPDLAPAARQLSAPGFIQALDRSIQWYQVPSTQSLFPVAGISTLWFFD